MNIKVLAIAAVLFFPAMMSGKAYGVDAVQRSYESPQVALEALVSALRAGNESEVRAIFGPGSEGILSSGDPEQDAAGRRSFLRHFDAKHMVEANGDRATAFLGEDDYPFPVPLVKASGRWVFDSAQGAEEILNRRIGKNELSAIAAAKALAAAQVEYQKFDRDRDTHREYAQKIFSDRGFKNGLYWTKQPGDDRSPLAALVAAAAGEGYNRSESGEPRPYHGYFFRMLTAQGQQAPGGKKSYLNRNKRLTEGFAFVAFPAKWGVSGVMSFIVGPDGVVWERNLGPKTSQLGAAMTEYDPDQTWKKVDSGGK